MSKKFRKAYENFTGMDSKNYMEIDINDFQDCFLLGKVHSIVYKAQKKQYGDKRPTLYEHKFKEQPLIVSNGTELLIIGKIKIDERGIHG